MTFKVAIYYFSNKGKEKASVLQEAISDVVFRNLDVEPEIMSSTDNIQADFENNDALIFIGALGIAVRKIAPFIKSKMSDPAVIVIDETFKIVIPVLSGHIGGANDFARIVADKFLANAVITTATDVNGVLSIDEIAVKNGLEISRKDGIKVINSKLLNNESVKVYADESIKISGLSNEFTLSDRKKADVIISSDERDKDSCILHLYNKPYALGVGCRKDTLSSIFENVVQYVMFENNISINQVSHIASIDIKRDEKAINDFANKYGLKFYTYSASELGEVKGEFDESEFVYKTTGVSNVSERAAKIGSFDGEFLVKRFATEGVTVSVFNMIRKVDLNGNS